MVTAVDEVPRANRKERRKLCAANSVDTRNVEARDKNRFGGRCGKVSFRFANSNGQYRKRPCAAVLTWPLVSCKIYRV